MAEEQLSPEQIAELQKKNCIFCRIIAGEMDSKKVFENDHFLAILDIRPATAGHVLLLPKEHVPILPLLSEDKLLELFRLATKISVAVQDAMIAQRTTLFIASGYAAGQQAPHLILHIIPREKNDGLDMLDLEKLDKPQADTLALASVFTQATNQSLLHLKRDDLAHQVHKRQPVVSTAVPIDTPAGIGMVKATGTAGELHTNTAPDSTDDTAEKVIVDPKTPVPTEFTTTNEALEAALSMAPDLRRLIIAHPDLVQDYVKRSPKLAKLFEGVNIRALSLMLQRQEQKPQRIAAEMNETELFTFIDGNEGLRIWVLDHPDELATNIAENPRLQQFFRNMDIKDLATRYRTYREGKR
jgi:histidine triad (HIT) family protein